ncbi:MAG TPA: hypothetical protein VFS24_10105 [Steroidobacteraceae bacterium]|nr:hypothetical protein [Steroidobacteraceae bacterium]
MNRRQLFASLLGLPCAAVVPAAAKTVNVSQHVSGTGVTAEQLREALERNNLDMMRAWGDAVIRTRLTLR